VSLLEVRSGDREDSIFVKPDHVFSHLCRFKTNISYEDLIPKYGYKMAIGIDFT
jgi:hypothetical protein